MEEIVKVKNLSKIYTIYDSPVERLKEALGNRKKKYGKVFYALQDINFTVERGKTLGIIGENGAGKSTLLKIITGVLEPSSGSVELNGKVSALLELGIGFNPEYTGIENIYLSANVMGLSKEEINSKMNDILDFADIGDFINQKVKTYSSGMFARLAFAVAINVEPEILIVDEALAVGDLFFQQKCNMYMKEKMGNCTKLLVTHDMSTIANMADSAIVISKGKQVFSGSPLEAIEYYTKKTHTDLYKRDTVSEKSFKEEEIHQNVWTKINKESLGGALEVKIVAYKLSINENEYQGYVKSNDKIRINVIIKSSKVIHNIIIGYQIKDKYGNIIFGENTHSSGYKEVLIYPDKKYMASISFSWPQIQQNTYFLTLGIGEGNHEMQHVIQCWAHNIIELSSITNLPNHGLFNNKIIEYEIKEVKEL